MPNLIAAVGRMHSGKGTLAKELAKYKYQSVAFAGPVKDISIGMLNYAFEYLGRSDLTIFDRDEFEEVKDDLRLLPQFVGTNLGREYVGPRDIWIQIALSTIDDIKEFHDAGRSYAMQGRARIVVDDLRFENEAQALRDEGFTIVRVVREEGERIASVTAKLRETILKKNKRKGIPPPSPFELEQMIDAKLFETIGQPSEQESDKIEADITVQNTSFEAMAEHAEMLMKVASFR